MTQKLQRLSSLFDEREEIYFIILLVLFTIFFLTQEVAFWHYGVMSLAAYSVLITGKSITQALGRRDD